MLLRLYTFYTISNKIYTEKIIFCLKIDNFNRNQLQYSRQSKSNDFYSYFNIIVIIRPLIFRMTGLWVVLLTYSDPVPCKCAPNPDIWQESCLCIIWLSNLGSNKFVQNRVLYISKNKFQKGPKFSYVLCKQSSESFEVRMVKFALYLHFNNKFLKWTTFFNYHVWVFDEIFRKTEIMLIILSVNIYSFSR